MKTRFILLFSLAFIACSKPYQHDKSYVDLVIKGNKLFALTSNGNINIFDTNTGIPIDAEISADTNISALSIDKRGTIFVVTDNNKLDKLDENTLTFSNVTGTNEVIYNIVFDKKNKGYLITEKGIKNIFTGKIYMPDTNSFFRRPIGGVPKPYVVFVDQDDNILLGYGFGEWGGRLDIFNTETGVFIKPDLNTCSFAPVKSIFTDGNAIYISCSLDHMLASGSIIKFTGNKCTTVFSSDYQVINTNNKRTTIDGEYIGPALYNKKDNCIYFYSQTGIFKGNKDKDLSIISNWTKIASPKLHWKYGQPDAAGAPMNVVKMAFADNGKLFLITQNDGIGVYDGKTFSLIN